IFEVGTACWVGMWLALRGEGRLAIAGWAAAIGTGVPFLFRLGLWLGVEPTLNQKLEGWGWFWPWIFGEWLGALLAIAFYLWVYRFAKRRVALELQGAEWAPRKALTATAWSLRAFFKSPFTRHASCRVVAASVDESRITHHASRTTSPP